MEVALKNSSHSSKITYLANNALQFFAFMIMPACLMVQGDGAALLIILFGIVGFIFSLRLIYPVFPRIVAFSLFVYMGWATVTATWSSYPPLGYLWGSIFIIMTGAGIIWNKWLRWADSDMKISILQFFVLGFLISQFLLLTLWGISCFKDIELSNFIAHEHVFVLCLGFWPAANYIFKAYGKTAVKAFLYLTILSCYALQQASSGIILLTGGLFVYWIAHKRFKFSKQFLVILLNSFIGLTGCIVLYILYGNNTSLISELPLKVQKLYKYWQEAIAIGAKHPFFGAGIGSYELSKGGGAFSPIQALQGQYEPVSSHHVYNPLLIIWVELGLIGVGAFLTVIFRFIKKINVRQRGTFPYVLAFASIGIAEFVTGYSIWNTWWYAAVLLILPLILIQENLLISPKRLQQERVAYEH